MATDKRIERLACRVYPLAGLVGGHGDPRDRGMAHPRQTTLTDDDAEPLAEALPDGGESAREVQGGDDGVLASALGGYGSERPQGESLGLRLRELRHGLSQGLANLATFGWKARGEPPAALRFFGTHKDAGKPRAFQVRKPVSGQTYPCKPMKGEG